MKARGMTEKSIGEICKGVVPGQKKQIANPSIFKKLQEKIRREKKKKNIDGAEARRIIKDGRPDSDISSTKDSLVPTSKERYKKNGFPNKPPKSTPIISAPPTRRNTSNSAKKYNRPLPKSTQRKRVITRIPQRSAPPSYNRQENYMESSPGNETRNQGQIVDLLEKRKILIGKRTKKFNGKRTQYEKNKLNSVGLFGVNFFSFWHGTYKGDGLYYTRHNSDGSAWNVNFIQDKVSAGSVSNSSGVNITRTFYNGFYRFKLLDIPYLYFGVGGGLGEAELSYKDFDEENGEEVVNSYSANAEGIFIAGQVGYEFNNQFRAYFEYQPAIYLIYSDNFDSSNLSSNGNDQIVSDLWSASQNPSHVVAGIGVNF